MSGNNYKIIGATVIAAGVIAAVIITMWPDMLSKKTIPTESIVDQSVLNVASVPLQVDKTLLDERGFIKVWELRMAISEAPIVYPFEDDQCSIGGEGDGEEEAPKLKSNKERLAYELERSRRQQQGQLAYAECLKEVAEKNDIKNKALAILNQTWMPVLLSATEKGDPVAEVILRLCETAPMLDRTDISSDCSTSPAEQTFARQRLEAINFKPALHKYTKTADDTLYYEEAKKSCTSSPGDCHYQAAADRYVNILSVMKTGYLGVAEYRNTCKIKGDSPESDKIAEECQRLMRLMEAVASEAPRFYSAGPLSSDIRIGFSNDLSLNRPVISRENGKARNTVPYETRGVVERTGGNKFSDPDFQIKFYDELERVIQTIESNIEEDLRKDPRWAVFLIERINGRLYDAMNKNDPKRPSVEEVNEYNENSQLAKAKKCFIQLSKWRTANVQELIASLHELRVTSLYHNPEAFPDNVKELEKRENSIPELAAAYYSDKEDGVYRFNIIMLLTYKLKNKNLSAEARDIIGKCLVDSLKDTDAWVRTEGVWGLKFTRDKKYEPEVRALIDDSDERVRVEASKSASALERR